MSLFPWTRHFRVPVAASSPQRTEYAHRLRDHHPRSQTATGHDGFAEPTAAVVDEPHQRIVPKGLLPGRGGVLLLGVRQDEDAIQVHDHMPTRVRRRFTGQPPDTFAHFGAGDAQRGQDLLPAPTPPC